MSNVYLRWASPTSSTTDNRNLRELPSKPLGDPFSAPGDRPRVRWEYNIAVRYPSFGTQNSPGLELQNLSNRSSDHDLLCDGQKLLKIELIILP